MKNTLALILLKYVKYWEILFRYFMNSLAYRKSKFILIGTSSIESQKGVYTYDSIILTY